MRELANLKLFGRPGHGAPTVDIRKKRFTEYQLVDLEKRRHQHKSDAAFNWSTNAREAPNGAVGISNGMMDSTDAYLTNGMAGDSSSGGSYDDRSRGTATKVSERIADFFLSARPTSVPADSDHYFQTGFPSIRLSVRPSQNFKIKRNSSPTVWIIASRLVLVFFAS